MAEITPFEADIAEQPDALRRLIGSADQRALRELTSREWGRIVFTGMGSSHFAALPVWRRLVGAGLPSWAVDAGQLIDNRGLLTADTLLIATSQSGASGEIVELLHGAGAPTVGAIVGVTADDESPLARAADVHLPLLSGPEATVSTKSYLNTLAVHARIGAAFLKDDLGALDAEIAVTADAVAMVIDGLDVSGIGAEVRDTAAPRLAAVGKGDASATSLFAGLITKESSKVPIEGYIGGQFRHGPYELAGPGLIAFLYGLFQRSTDSSMERLAQDLVDSGSRVVLIGDAQLDGASTLRVPSGSSLVGLATSSVAAELIAVDIARARGVTPGAFAFGSKVTTTL
ncbi:SIS domain-containing protein [Amnibacterium sp. CER49]|uniref:SIS domain-containing protein n=1 Tax=Amnibacterium sp. CER49 TaxID=3039161 RepID=UPI00244C25B3|nr:SIS domain-containing protein [Amnibacterium sp. CER49]MDH2443311.1 SIS domain-containing protein [Amnibacterium sp. CER49]